MDRDGDLPKVPVRLFDAPRFLRTRLLAFCCSLYFFLGHCKTTEMNLVDRLTGCVLILAGLAQLHGAQKKNALLARHLLVLVASLAAFSIFLLKVPVVGALPGTFLLMRWIVSVLREYEKDNKTVREGLLWISATTLVAVVLYTSFSSLDRRGTATDIDGEFED